MAKPTREEQASPGHPEHRVAPFEPTDGKVTEQVVHKFPTLTPEEANWQPPADDKSAGLLTWLKKILDEQRKTRGEARIAAQLEPREWQTFIVQVPPGTTPATIIGSEKNRRDLMITNLSPYTVNVTQVRSGGQGGNGFPIGPGGSLTMRTRGAVYGCAPTAPATTSTSQGVPINVQVTEELY